MSLPRFLTYIQWMGTDVMGVRGLFFSLWVDRQPWLGMNNPFWDEYYTTPSCDIKNILLRDAGKPSLFFFLTGNLFIKTCSKLKKKKSLNLSNILSALTKNNALLSPFQFLQLKAINQWGSVDPYEYWSLSCCPPVWVFSLNDNQFQYSLGKVHFLDCTIAGLVTEGFS